MKDVFVLFLFTFLFLHAKGDSAEIKKISADSLLLKIENSRRKIDFTLKRADAYFDSITGKNPTHIDTLSLLELRQELANQQKSSSQKTWITGGVLILASVLAIFAWWRKKKKKQSRTIDSLR